MSLVSEDPPFVGLVALAVTAASVTAGILIVSGGIVAVTAVRRATRLLTS